MRRSGNVPWAPLAVAAAYTLLILAWVFGNPPHGGPDELSHYVRAASLGRGDLIGAPGRAQAIVGETRPDGMSEQTYRDQLAWTAATARTVVLPDGLSPAWYCKQTDPFVSARCVDETPIPRGPQTWTISSGGYEPLPYLLPALASRLPASPNHLVLPMRLAKALSCLLLLVPALVLLWRGSEDFLSLLGPVVALTPMVVYLAATLNPSGLEAVSALAFYAAVLRLARDGQHPRWTWVLLGASAFVLALSRGPAVLWVAVGAVLLVLLLGVGRTVALVLAERRFALPALAAAALGVVGNRIWEGLYGSRLVFDPTPLRPALNDGWSQLQEVVREQIGVFDYLEIGMPSWAYGVWKAAVIALLVTALLVGRRQDRLLLTGAFLASLALPVVLVAATMRHTGFGIQGRYVLPFTVVVPLLAGEVVLREREALRRLGAAGLFVPFAVAAAIVQVAAWWANARRFAVGIGGPRLFFWRAEWSPPLGWCPWLACLLTGAALLAGVAPLSRVLSRRRSRSAGAAAATGVGGEV